MTGSARDELKLGEPVDEGNRTITARAEWSARLKDGVAEGASRLRRPVLVKTLKPGLRLTPALGAAFRRQAQRLQRMNHPLLPTLLDFVDEPERVALIFPDHGGVRLERVLEQVGKLDVSTAMAIGIEVARAMAVIHRHGYAHGRLVATHVELSPGGTVRLFGLDATATAEGDDSSDADGVLPLPEDMAPEQIIGQPADVRTDVFLLGLLLFRMVVGEKPFRGGDGVGVAQRIRHGKAPQLSAPGRDVPAALQHIVARCLSKRARDRFPDMSSVASSLIRALRSRSSAAIEHFVSHALARADLVEAMAPAAEPDEAVSGSVPRALVRRVVGATAAVAVAAAVGWVIIDAIGEPEPQANSAVRGIEQQPARLRVLARPWAEVHVDGKLIDVTPMAQAIEVSPGRHRVRFVHPNAPDQIRSVEVIAGQTLWLDVTMAVVRPPPDAGAADGATDASP